MIISMQPKWNNQSLFPETNEPPFWIPHSMRPGDGVVFLYSSILYFMFLYLFAFRLSLYEARSQARQIDQFTDLAPRIPRICSTSRGGARYRFGPEIAMWHGGHGFIFRPELLLHPILFSLDWWWRVGDASRQLGQTLGENGGMSVLPHK